MSLITQLVDQELNLDQDKFSLLTADIPLSEKTNDTPVAKAIRASVEKSKQSHCEQVGEVAVELLEESKYKRQILINEARELRRRAKELTTKATNLYNAEVTLVSDTRIAPLAFLLDHTSTAQDIKVQKMLSENPLKDYWKEAKKSQNSADAE